MKDYFVPLIILTMSTAIVFGLFMSIAVTQELEGEGVTRHPIFPVKFNGVVYAEEDILTLCNYHGIEVWDLNFIPLDKNETKVVFFRNGQKCSLFTHQAKAYLLKNR